MEKIAHTELLRLLSYDRSRGVFLWRSKVSNRRSGSIAGSIDKDGYRIICIFGQMYRSARLAWFYETGEWPQDCIDHIDGNPSNDSFDNLRLATRSQNQANRLARGYYPIKNSSKFHSHIRINNTQIHLGVFNTESEARHAYIKACKKYQDNNFLNRKLAGAQK